MRPLKESLSVIINCKKVSDIWCRGSRSATSPVWTNTFNASRVKLNQFKFAH